MCIRTGAAVDKRRFRRDVVGAVPYDGFNGAFVGAAAPGGPLWHRQCSGHFSGGSKPPPYGGIDDACAGDGFIRSAGAFCGMHKCIPYGVGAMARTAWRGMCIRTGAAVDKRRFRRDVEGAVPYDGFRSCIRRGRRPRRPVAGTGKVSGMFPAG